MLTSSLAFRRLGEGKVQKPKIDLVLSLREPMRRGEKDELRENYNLRDARFFTVIPTTDPWSTSLKAVPISECSGDILILTEEDELDDIWNVFLLLKSSLWWSHALSGPELLGAGWGRYVARMIAGADKTS